MITLISGTNRPGSNTRKITAALESIYTTLGAEVKVLDLLELPPDLFLPASYAEKPAAFAPFADTILASKGLVIITPEYNGGFPGALKYFIDMLPFPASFEHRPVAFVGLAAGIWGAIRPVEQLEMIFGYRNGFIFPERVFIPGVGKKFGEDGKIKDEELVGRLETQAKNFIAFVKKLKD